MARCEKVAEAIRQEVSNIIIRDELKDPRLGFVTITGVELTGDLRYAKIFYSVLGSVQEQINSKKAMESGLGFIRRLIAQRIRLRFVPELALREDHSSEYSVRIQEVLNEIKELSQPVAEAKNESNKRKEKKREPKKSKRVHKRKK